MTDPMAAIQHFTKDEAETNAILKGWLDKITLNSSRPGE